MRHIATFFCFCTLNIAPSHAAITIDVVESGGNVVATASGTANTAGVTATGTRLENTASLIKGRGTYIRFDGEIAVGTGEWDQYPIDEDVLNSV